ncbi:pilus assembly protein [Burkholderia ubonensis]|nr:pilus assembly protein [Burkholderia ubonensis]
MAELSFNGQNRFIMTGKRMAVTLVNEDKEAALAEVSLDWGDEGRTEDLPMAVSRPLLKIPPQWNAPLEILYQGEGLPSDRESYFLLNVLDVPQAPKVPHVLQIALRHRLKLFYRPPLKEAPDDAMAALTWEMSSEKNGAIRIGNPSPYYLTLSDIERIGQDGRRCGEPIEHMMLAPFSTQSLAMSACRPERLRYQVVSDAGNMRPYAATLSPGRKQHGISQL